ncbi:proline iminopeptidase [Hymenobacter daecheongensis DSM 21074]|uniref:Proline iminopeptidase n=1 Tax=Hymenobacter daecheongensis DSM 21074 TaxID=1121955 RepID=A0A1M6KRL8_9BACT|nr:alpha/beta hydrolase [Hymenobacter daecheongensis]SHJ61599.1 proline iminopeptidase [Hymenobacter daecheongensis DSM 21074]
MLRSALSRLPFALLLLSLLLVFTLGQARHLPKHTLTNGPTTLLTSDSVRLYVRVAGQGTPCVFVHGGPGAGSYAFEQLGGRPLEQQLHMIYFDQRGSGRSASPAGNAYSMPRMVQDLEELRRQLGLERWVVMAHSFGGAIATAYAAQYPQRVQALILVNGVLNPPASLEAMLSYGTALLPAEARPDAALSPMQRFGLVMGALQQRQLGSRLQFSSDSLAARTGRASRGSGPNHDFAAQVFGGRLPDYGHDYVPASATLTMPVLTIVGQDDRTTGAEAHTFRFPRQQVVVVPGKHYSFVEQPATFRRAVVSFVQKLPRNS